MNLGYKVDENKQIILPKKTHVNFKSGNSQRLKRKLKDGCRYRLTKEHGVYEISQDGKTWRREYEQPRY